MDRSYGLVLWLLALPLCAQDYTPGQDYTPAQETPVAGQTQAPQNQPPGQTADREKVLGTNNGKIPGTSNDRLFFTLPNFLTLENAGNVPPLTAGEKFKAVARGSFDPVEFAWYGAVAGIGQAENSEPRYGQGAAGYAQRYAVQFADGTIENFMSHAVLPALLHQDPRYFQLGKGGFWHRTGYAVTRIFIIRGDSGQESEFNFSEVIGAAAAAGISTYTYHLRDERNLPSALGVWGTQMGYDALGYVVKEFWPDIRRKLHKAKSG
jgi:hypothetical protein